MICSDCLVSHEHQVIDYPAGARVVNLAPIQYLHAANDMRAIPVPTLGRVLHHTDDGRAVIDFDGFKGTHTFHHPDSWVARCYPEFLPADANVSP